METITRDDTEHDVEYVTKADAEREIEAWKERADYWQNLCTLYADERNELRDAIRKAATEYKLVKWGWDGDCGTDKIMGRLEENPLHNETSLSVDATEKAK